MWIGWQSKARALEVWSSTAETGYCCSWPIFLKLQLMLVTAREYHTNKHPGCICDEEPSSWCRMNLSSDNWTVTQGLTQVLNDVAQHWVLQAAMNTRPYVRVTEERATHKHIKYAPTHIYPLKQILHTLHTGCSLCDHFLLWHTHAHTYNEVHWLFY